MNMDKCYIRWSLFGSQHKNLIWKCFLCTVLALAVFLWFKRIRLIHMHKRSIWKKLSG